MENPITAFEGSNGFLSNFFREKDGSTVEHEFQAAKTFDLQEKVEILTVDTPGKAKRLGRKATMRDDWEQVRIGIMRDFVLRKFLDDRDLAIKLFDTGDAELIEGNSWHDNFWGECWCPECTEIPGENHLGQILMEIRELINSYNEE